jgi:diguanylate cyclase (GGDEF)-like protein/PAS domain S-box-containing protein
MSQYDFEKFFDLSLDMLCIAGTDGYFKHVNASCQRVLGWTPEELTAKPFVDFIHPDDIESTLKEVEKLATGIPTISFKNRYRCSDGSYRYLLWTAYPEEKTGLLFAVAHDITEYQHFQLAIDTSPVALIMIDRTGSIRLVNRETERLFGYQRDFLIGKAIEMLVPANNHTQHQRDRVAFFQNPGTRSMGIGRQLLAVHRDGIKFPVEIGLNPIYIGAEMLVVCAVVDLTLQKQVEERMTHLAEELDVANKHLEQLALTDQLTNLFNRRAFDEQVDKQFKLMRRLGHPISLLLIDIDHFKQVNDKFGHAVGDEALKSIAKLLIKLTRATDVVTRYGGEEFAVILPNTNKEGALIIADKFRVAIHTHNFKHGKSTISVGVSTMTPDKLEVKKNANQITNLISNADQALYSSKENGRNRTTHFSDIVGLDKAT